MYFELWNSMPQTKFLIKNIKTLMKTNFRWTKQVKEVLGEDKQSIRVMGFQIVFCKKKFWRINMQFNKELSHIVKINNPEEKKWTRYEETSSKIRHAIKKYSLQKCSTSVVTKEIQTKKRYCLLKDSRYPVLKRTCEKQWRSHTPFHTAILSLVGYPKKKCPICAPSHRNKNFQGIIKKTLNASINTQVVKRWFIQWHTTQLFL